MTVRDCLHGLQATLLITIALWSLPGETARKALVIGNSNYAQGRLDNPAHDADDMEKRLRQLGFAVTLLKDRNKSQLRDALDRFSDQLMANDDVIVYYAGHAAQVKEKAENYLVPIGTQINRDIDLEDEGLRVGRIMAALEPAKNGFKLIILDACRDNPYPSSQRSGSRGLARVTDSPAGTVVWYATEPGKTADDGDGRNGTFTHFLLQGLAQPGLSYEQVFKWTARAVRDATDGKQIPYPEGISLVDFLFIPGDTVEPLPIRRPPPQDPEPETASPEQPNHVKTRPQTGSVLRDPMNSGGQGPAMVFIAGGSFQMGSPPDETGRDSNERQHAVEVGDFYIGQTEVTVGEFKRFVEATGHKTDAERNAGGEQGCFSEAGTSGNFSYQAGRSWRNPGFSQTAQHPVVCVSHSDAQAYVEWLSEQTGQTYRLPTEAQWEYAARAGTRTARPWEDDETSECSYANGADRAEKRNYTGTKMLDCDDGYIRTAPVKTFPPNAWNLYDSLGNVWEWTCSAWDAESEYGGAENVCNYNAHAYANRGGGWENTPLGMRSASRSAYFPTGRGGGLGFRLSRTR